MIKAKGLPSRFSRFCCTELKEYKILDNCILGVRKSESRKRNSNYTEPTICYKQRILNYPILYWTDEDIEEFINVEKIRCHPLYYVDGKFDVKKRLGCIGCPLKSKNKRIEDFKKYPGFLRQYIKNANYYYRNGHKYFLNAFEVLYFELFFSNMIDFNYSKSGIFGKVNVKELMMEKFPESKLDDL